MALYSNVVAFAVVVGIASSASTASTPTDAQHVEGISNLMIPASFDSRLEEYRRRFQEFRRDPNLMRGHALRGLDVDLRRLKVTDHLRGYSFTLGAKTGNNDGYFILADLSGANIRGRVDRYVNDENEWIYVLREIKTGPPLVSGTMELTEVQYVADLIQTIIDEGAIRPVTVFVLYAP